MRQEPSGLYSLLRRKLSSNQARRPRSLKPRKRVSREGWKLQATMLYKPMKVIHDSGKGCGSDH